jgi:hypothetical protein
VIHDRAETGRAIGSPGRISRVLGGRRPPSAAALAALAVLLAGCGGAGPGSTTVAKGTRAAASARTAPAATTTTAAKTTTPPRTTTTPPTRTVPPITSGLPGPSRPAATPTSAGPAPDRHRRVALCLRMIGRLAAASLTSPEQRALDSLCRIAGSRDVARMRAAERRICLTVVRDSGLPAAAAEAEAQSCSLAPASGAG